MKNDKEKSIRAVERFNRCMVLIEYDQLRFPSKSTSKKFPHWDIVLEKYSFALNKKILWEENDR